MLPSVPSTDQTAVSMPPSPKLHSGSSEPMWALPEACCLLLSATGGHVANSGEMRRMPPKPRPQGYLECSHCSKASPWSHSRQGTCVQGRQRPGSSRLLHPGCPLWLLPPNRVGVDSLQVRSDFKPITGPHRPDREGCQTQLQVPQLGKHSCSCGNSWMAQSSGHGLSFQGCKTTQQFLGCFKVPAWA